MHGLDPTAPADAAQRSIRVSLEDILRVDFTHYEVGVSPEGVRLDDYARRVRAACAAKTARNLGRDRLPDLGLRCSACVYHTSMPGIYLYADGRCNMCHAYATARERALAGGVLEAEREACLAPSPEARVDVVVALSGGKDSSATLAYLALERGLRVEAVMVDNGYIPDFVIAGGEAMCRRAGSSFQVLAFDFARELEEMLAEPEPQRHPCHVCSKRFKQFIADHADAAGCPRVALGRNFWARIEPELTGVAPVAGASGRSVGFYSLPFLLGWKQRDLAPRLERIDWDVRNRDIQGLSTNCRVPGLIEDRFKQTTGINPDAPLLANEVITGFLTRDEALADLGES